MIGGSTAREGAVKIPVKLVSAVVQRKSAVVTGKLFEAHIPPTTISPCESTSRQGAGIVEFHHRTYNQNDKLVAECRRQVFMPMRPR